MNHIHLAYIELVVLINSQGDVCESALHLSFVKDADVENTWREALDKDRRMTVDIRATQMFTTPAALSQSAYV